MRSFLNHLTEQCDGPFYVLDLLGIRSEVERLTRAFGARFANVMPAYSYKTNSLEVVTLLMKGLGLAAEVVSGPELMWALADGFAEGDIVFNGPLKTDEELALAIKNRARLQVDSLDELQRAVGMTSRDEPLALAARLTSECQSGRLSRFGFTADEFRIANSWLRSIGREFSGVHMHIGSNVGDPQAYVTALRKALPVISSMWPSIKWIDIGGGFPAESSRRDASQQRIPLESFADRLRMFFEEEKLSIDDKLLIVEPGRCLVEDHGYLLSRVEVRKDRPDGSLVVTNGGTHLVRSIRNWSHPIGFLRSPSDGERWRRYDVYGSNCFESDSYGVNVLGPDDLGPGDWVIIGSAGGYDIPSANVWSRPAPPIFAYCGTDTPLVARRAQRPEEMRVLAESEHSDE